MALIRGIEKGDKDLRHFTFDDEDYVVRGGIYYYKVNYGKNKLEGEAAEDEIGFVECSKVITLGGRKPSFIPGVEKKDNGNNTQQSYQKPAAGSCPFPFGTDHLNQPDNQVTKYPRH